MRKILSNKVFWIFTIFFFLVLLEHQALWLYHDDYGYASLSYLFNYNGAIGMNTSFRDIIDFLIFHYNNWGGRILYFLIEIISLRIGLPFYRFLQSLIITIIFVLIYKIVSKYTKMNDYKLAIFSCACYGLFEIMTFRSGIFWPTASVLYIFPMLPFLLFIYLYKPNMSGLKYFLCLILIFLASWSQEQTSTMALAFIGIYTLHDFILTKKFNLKNITMCLSSLIGFTLLLLAPGSMTRLNSSADFANLSLITKIKYNLPLIISNVFGSYTKIFTILFFLVCFYWIYMCQKKENKFKLFNKVALISDISILIYTALREEGYFSYFFNLVDNNIYKNFMMIVLTLQLGLILLTVLVYFYNQKKYLLIYLIISSCCSLAVMLVAPYYPLRSNIMFNIVFFIIALYTFAIILKTKINTQYILIPLLIISFINFAAISFGYYVNNKVNVYNDKILKESSVQIKNGNIITSIELKKLPDALYAIEMPYDENYDYIKTYMKYYYDLPQDVLLEYK